MPLAEYLIHALLWFSIGVACAVLWMPNIK